MLAWVHQAVASENELLGALIASDSGSNDAPAPADTAASGLGVISTPELLDKVYSLPFKACHDQKYSLCIMRPILHGRTLTPV